jgi:hypothetical protein
MGTPANGTATAAVAALPKKRRRLASGVSLTEIEMSCFWVMGYLLFSVKSNCKRNIMAERKGVDLSGNPFYPWALVLKA